MNIQTEIPEETVNAMNLRPLKFRGSLQGKLQPILIIALALFLLMVLIIRVSANPTGFASFEFEDSEVQLQGTTIGEDADASDGTYLVFAVDGSGSPADTTPPATDQPDSPPQDNSDDPDPNPATPPLARATDDLGDLIRSYPNGGIVTVPNGTYKVSDVTGYAPNNPLVLVAQTDGGVDIVRSANVLGETDQKFTSSRDITFIGFDFVNVMVALYDSSGFNFYHTNHTYPPQASPEPLRKLCGGERDPTTFIIRGSKDIGLYGVNIDGAGHDGIKVGTSEDIDIVGSSITNVGHQSVQTQTTAADAATCGHSASDKFHHADDIQISPGGVKNLTIRNSYTDGRHVWQVSGSGTSIEDVLIEDSVLYNRSSSASRGVLINTRVKESARNASSSVVEITLKNTATHINGSTAANRHVYTAGTVSGAVKLTRIGSTYVGSAPTTNPSVDWQAANTLSEWRCFVSDILGYTQYQSYCDGLAPEDAVAADPTPTPTVVIDQETGNTSADTSQKKRTDYPTASTTGFRAAGLTQSQLQPSNRGSRWVIREDGAVLEGFYHAGTISVQADNVTIRNAMIVGTGSKLIDNAGSNLRVENTLIRGGALRTALAVPTPCDAAIGSGGYTAVRVDVSNCADGFKISGSVSIVDSYIHDLYSDRRGNGAGTHNDAVQQTARGSLNSLVFRGNSVYMDPCTSNRAFQIGLFGSNLFGNYLIESNFFWGSIGVVNFQNKDGASGNGSATIRNNLIAGSSTRGPFSDAGGSGSNIGLYTGSSVISTSITGNVFEDGSSADASKYRPYVCDSNYN